MYSDSDISTENAPLICEPVADYCRQYSQLQGVLDFDFSNDVKTKRGDIRVIELFAGVGGFRIGLERASSRYKTVWSNQWEPSTKRQDASLIYCRNFGYDGHSNQDISTVEVDSIPDADLLCGGFPCQDYSVATTLKNSGGIEGKKGVLWWQICRILLNCKHKPKYLFLENVDRLLKSPASQRGRDFAIILSSLSDLGYDVEWRVINAAEYGMPQRRCRTYMVGYLKSTNINGKSNYREWVLKEGIIAKAFPCYARTGKKEKISHFTIKGDLPDISDNFNRSDSSNSPFLNAGYMSEREVYSVDVDANYSGRRLTLGDILIDEKNVPSEYFISEEAFPKWQYLKGSKSEVRTTSAGYQYNYSEGSMAFPDATDKPSRTIITGEGGPSASRFKHVIKTPSGKYRRLLPLELERLNMFPDNHTLGASDIRRAFLLGNALVTGIVEALGRELLKRVKNE